MPDISSVQSPKLGCPSHPLYSYDEGRDTHIYLIAFGRFHHVSKRGAHHAREITLDLLILPVIAHPVLHPFKIGNRNTSRIAEDVGNYKDTSFV